MPLYEYRCAKCGAHVEKIRKFSDPPFTKCEECGGKLERLLSSPAFRFKGTGWYVTDYANKSASGNSEKSEKQKSEGATADKSEKTNAGKESKQSGSDASGSKEPLPALKTEGSKARSRK